jgi:hypothetical protein
VPGITSPPPQNLKLSGEYEAEFCTVHSSVSKDERKEGWDVGMGGVEALV